MHTETSSSSPASGQDGFALALVVLLLFAIASAGAAGYQVVRIEAFQAQQSTESEQALGIAQAGMEWFLGTQRGLVPDTSTYNINGGNATIFTRKVASLSPEEDLYFVESEGNFTDPRFPNIPALRTVSQYAVYRKSPVNVMAPIMTTAGRTRVQRNGRVYGNDLAPTGSCTSAVGATLAGAVGRNQVEARSGGVINGSPRGLTLGSFQSVVDSVDTAWDVYSDPNFPVDYDGTWPNFSSLPSDSFPVVRVNGNFSPNWSKWGRGVLIVTGQLRINDWTWWSWNGIILANSIRNVRRRSYANIYGVLVGGQDSQMGNLNIDGGNFRYHSCNVEKAGMALAHMSPIDNSWWEDSGG